MGNPTVKPLWTNEQILASALRYLLDGEEEMAARVLLACSLTIRDRGDEYAYHRIAYDESVPLGMHHIYDITLRGPRFIYEILCKEDNPIYNAIYKSIDVVLPTSSYPVMIDNFNIQVEIVSIDPDWRDELRELLRGKEINNQGGGGGGAKSELRTWNQLRFRSQSEIRIAEALEQARVLFLPNCMSRLNTPDGRRNREPDFLVCHQGKWGILQVDGEPYHPPNRVVQDHQWDRLFKNHGVRIVEHYDATRCYNKPREVVSEFLELLTHS